MSKPTPVCNALRGFTLRPGNHRRTLSRSCFGIQTSRNVGFQAAVNARLAMTCASSRAPEGESSVAVAASQKVMSTITAVASAGDAPESCRIPVTASNSARCTGVIAVLIHRRRLNRPLLTGRRLAGDLAGAGYGSDRSPCESFVSPSRSHRQPGPGWGRREAGSTRDTSDTSRRVEQARL